MGHSYRNNDKPSVEEFKKKHPELFKEDSWGISFRTPSESAVLKSWQIQEALNHYPKGRIKSLLEDYYDNMPLEKLCKKYKIKDTKNASVVIYKAKNKVAAFYDKLKNTPIDSTNYVIIKMKVIKREESVGYCFKVGKLDLSEEPFWVGPTLLRLDDDIQDFLETDSRYVNDFVVAEGSND